MAHSMTLIKVMLPLTGLVIQSETLRHMESKETCKRKCKAQNQSQGTRELAETSSLRHRIQNRWHKYTRLLISYGSMYSSRCRYLVTILVIMIHDVSTSLKYYKFIATSASSFI